MGITYLGNGIYTFSEAARLTRVNANRIRAWFLGTQTQKPFAKGDYANVPESSHLMSFLDLTDTLIAGRLREHGVSLQYLRRAREALAQEFHTTHPFSWKKLLTDGKRVFVHVADECGEEQLRDLLTRQQAFPRILSPYLKQIDYDPSTLLARRWRASEGIVLDPGRQYGKPIVETAGIPTTILASAYVANGSDEALVSEWYGVSSEEVRAAVEFERLLGTCAA